MTLLRAAAFVLLPTLTLGTVVLTGTAKPLRAAASASLKPAEPSVRLVGVMVNPELEAASEANDFPTLAFQGTMAKTKLALVVDVPGGGIIGLHRESSAVEAFEDASGRELLDPDSPFPPFGFAERVLRDGKRLALEIEGSVAPAPRADAVLAQGTLAIRVAHEKRVEASAETDWKKGQSVTAGSYAFTVVEYRDAQWGGGYELELKTAADLGPVIEYAAVSADGTRTPLSVRSTMTFGNDSRISLHSDAPIGRAMLEVTAWKDAKTKRVPFSVRASVGLR